mmetsp:Transcript_9221/g.20175  ORF Transcript_9221/g.20175 Transcript_9221/m.20175 type:complete len:250 (+) Transcript_9221:1957-2706(+)
MEKEAARLEGEQEGAVRGERRAPVGQAARAERERVLQLPHQLGVELAVEQGRGGQRGAGDAHLGELRRRVEAVPAVAQRLQEAEQLQHRAAGVRRRHHRGPLPAEPAQQRVGVVRADGHLPLGGRGGGGRCGVVAALHRVGGVELRHVRCQAVVDGVYVSPEALAYGGGQRPRRRSIGRGGGRASRRARQAKLTNCLEDGHRVGERAAVEEEAEIVAAPFGSGVWLALRGAGVRRGFRTSSSAARRSAV